MEGIWAYFSSVNFAPHGYCILWRKDLLMMLIGSDLIIALSYFSIPIALFLLVRGREDFQYKWVLRLFAVFILACGATHTIEVWNIWHADYYLEGVVKVITAMVSLLTAVLIWPILPRLLSIPSQAMLAQSNQSLIDEMQRRELAEQELRQLYESLEQEVAARTQELQQAKQALELQILVGNRVQRRLQSIFESAPNGMIVVNRSGRILQANGLAHSIFRFLPGELKGIQVEQLVPLGHRDQHVDDRGSYVEAPTKRMMGDRKDLYGLCSDGSMVPVEIGLNPVEGSEEGEIVASIVDISERKEYERRIENRNNALERSNKELEEFAFIASHDLREPLRKVISFSKLLLSKDYGALTQEGEEFAGYVVGAAERMRELLDSLLSYSRVTSRGGVFAPTDLNKVVQEVLTDLQLVLDETEASVSLEKLVNVEADSSQIRQLLQNIVANALKYRSKDNKPKIAISGETKLNGLYCLRIEDNGIGFERDYSEQIFEVFKRLHGRSEYPGTGMGLAICRKIVDRHGGRIWAESTLGQGSVFYIELPMKQKREVSLEL